VVHLSGSTIDSERQDASKLHEDEGVASNAKRQYLRREATVNGGSRPGRATESATGHSPNDPDLAIVVAAWLELPKTVRAVIVAIVEAALQ